MQSIRLLVGANLRRRRGEILLVALSIAAATMSVATAIPILLGVSRSVDVTFDKLHAAHLLMIFDTQTCNAASTIQWWRQRPGTIAVTETMPTKPIWGGFWHNDRHIDQSLMLVRAASGRIGERSAGLRQGERDPRSGARHGLADEHLGRRQPHFGRRFHPDPGHAGNS